MKYERLEDPRSEVMRILRVLTYFYSFRDLEELLQVHFQNLWKYVNLRSIPEKETASKIIHRISELKLLDRIIDEELRKANGELYLLTRNPGFLELYALKFTEYMESIGVENLNSIIALSKDSISLAAAIALNTGALVCYVMDSARLESSGLTATFYKSRRYKELKPLIIPKMCLKKDGSIAIVDLNLEDPDMVIALDTLIRRERDATLIASFITLNRDVYEELSKSLGLKVMVLRLI